MGAKNITKATVISYIAIFANIVISFFYTPWMIRKIGVSDYGLYHLTISFVSYFLMDFGLSNAVQRFVAKYRAEGDEDKVAKMVGLTTRVYLIIDVVIFVVLLVLFFFINQVFTGLTSEEIERLKGLYLIAGIFSVLNFIFKPMDGAMMAYELFVEQRALELINKVGIVIIVCAALALGADVFALVLINGAISLLVSIIKYFVFKQKSKLQIQWNYYEKGELKSVFSFSLWAFVSMLAQRLRFSLIPTVLGILSNSDQIAIFALGSSLEGMVYVLSTGLNGLFLPKVSRLVHSGSRESIIDLMIRVGRIQLYLICLIFFGFVVLGRDFVLLWVGNHFHNVYYILIFLIISNIVSLTQHIANDLVLVENQIRKTSLLIFATSTIGLIIACVLAPCYGAVGCAIGTGAGLCIYQLFVNVFYRHVMGIDVLRFFKECHMRILPISILIAVIFYFIMQRFTIDTWLEFIIAGAIFAVSYLLICYFLLFSKEEKILCKSLIYK